MNYRIIFHMAGRVLLAEAGLLVLPLAVSLLYREDCAWAVLASMAVAAVLGGLLAILLFTVLPTLIVGGVNHFVTLGRWAKVVLEAVLKVAIFLTYMAAISRMKEIHRVFEYHGAEHKTIACYEAGDPLTVENVRKYTRFHPRCGTRWFRPPTSTVGRTVKSRMANSPPITAAAASIISSAFLPRWSPTHFSKAVSSSAWS